MTEIKQMGSKGKKRDVNDWDDWGGYMRDKIRKLDEQFEDMKNGDEPDIALSSLFTDVVIFVNGYTVPSSDELKRLMKKYGGGYQHYYSKARVTHIIATNLPHSKLKELRDEKVVHPNWITDSIKHGKLLPCREYLLYGPGGKYKESGGLRGSLMNFVKVHDTPTEAKHGTNSEIAKTKTDGLTSSNASSDISCNAASGDSDILEESIDSFGQNNSKSPSFDINGNNPIENTSTNVTNCNPSLGVTETTERPRSTGRKHSSVPKAGDPNFVSEFYSHSRLHYLSTWGAEFREFINHLIQTTDLKTTKRSPSKVASKNRVIMHIDMDSFFVSVTLRSKPELKGKPVAVCHAGRGTGASATTGSDSSSSFGSASETFASTSEIASCSYEARACGVRNGMWLGQARNLCPGLVCVPYEFQQYREVSQKLYEILASYTHEIQAVSCDEAFVDVTHCVETERLTPLQLAHCIRNEIQSKTKCPASAGIAPNILLARMCTRVAKPNGQFYLQPEDVERFISNQKAKDLPGVGYSLNQKLERLNVVTCKDLQRISLQVLRCEFGQKTGEMLYKYCRGQDDRQLKIERERKSISAEINYAIRFGKDSEPQQFISDLSNEVHRRMKTAGVKGKHLTFKLRVRQKDAPVNPVKFMGCGRCDNISRSTSLASFTDDPNIIAKECVTLLKHLGLPVSDIRGMGIQMSKLLTDSRNASSSTTSSKTLHDFMKPFTKLSATITSASDDISDAHTSVPERKDQRKKETVTSGHQPRKSLDSVTLSRANIKSPCDSDDASECVAKHSDGDSVDEKIPDALTEGRGARPGRSSQANEVASSESLDEFSLVLSEDETEEPTLVVCQRSTKGNRRAPGHSNLAEPNRKQDTVIPHTISDSYQNTYFPPLPVFPIFSPPSGTPVTSPSRASTSKCSPSRPKTRSPSQLNGSPLRGTKRSPGTTKSSPSSPGRSPRRSPAGRSSVQRSLQSSFQSAKGTGSGLSLSLPSPSQIDPAVFEALPEEIKKDIENSYQQNNQRLTLRSDGDCGSRAAQPHGVKLPSPSQWDPDVVRCLPAELTSHLRNEYERAERTELPETSKLRNPRADKIEKTDRQDTQRTTKSRTKSRTIRSFGLSKVAPEPAPYLASSRRDSNATADLDPSVLEALPVSLRHEAQLAYEQQRRHDDKERRTGRNSSVFPSGLDTNQSNNNSIHNIVASASPKVSLAGAQTLPEVKEMLKLWTTSTEDPLDDDVSVLVEYLGNLICEKDLERMCLVLKSFRRLVTNRDDSWYHVFNTVLDSTQAMIRESYGCQLPLEYLKNARLTSN